VSEAGALDPRLVEAAGALVAEQAGCRLDQLLLDRLPEVVIEAAAAGGNDPGRFLAGLAGDPAGVQALIDLVTVQETWFFREPSHFEALATRVLPELGDSGVVWSAGCANGQEPWSLAMVLAEAGRPGWQVLGTDVSTRALARADGGSYGQRELRGLSATRRARFMVPHGDVVAVGPELRAAVCFARHNLAGEPAPLPAGTCRVVFCRNTLIYLRPERRKAALDAIAALLRPGGWLFLGVSESLGQATDAFEAVKLDGVYAYRRTGAAPAEPPQPAAPPRGRAAARAGSAHADAAPAPRALDEVATARQAVYERPDDPVAHLELGLRLEATGDRAAARRSFAAARGALERVDPAAVEAALEGWRADQLAALLTTKLREGGDPGGPRWNR